MSEKSILEQALLQVQNLEEAVKQNAKGILASTMKEELNQLLKESEMEEKSEKPRSMRKDIKAKPDQNRNRYQSRPLDLVQGLEMQFALVALSLGFF